MPRSPVRPFGAGLGRRLDERQRRARRRNGRAGAAASTIGGGSAPAADQCIFDGYILSQKIHLETGVTNSTVTVWGQDVSWLMNLEEKVREWVDVTEAQVAAQIFGDYGVTPADENTDEDSPAYTEDNHSLMQRGSDIAFLRMLARRSGKVLRIACADQPGIRTGYFAAPNLDGDAVANLAINDDEQLDRQRARSRLGRHPSHRRHGARRVVQ